MPTLLHILTSERDSLALELIEQQRAQAGQQAAEQTIGGVVDLTQPNPDYAALLEQIFAADSIAVW